MGPEPELYLKVRLLSAKFCFFSVMTMYFFNSLKTGFESSLSTQTSIILA